MCIAYLKIANSIHPSDPTEYFHSAMSVMRGLSVISVFSRNSLISPCFPLFFPYFSLFSNIFSLFFHRLQGWVLPLKSG